MRRDELAFVVSFVFLNYFPCRVERTNQFMELSNDIEPIGDRHSSIDVVRESVQMHRLPHVHVRSNFDSMTREQHVESIRLHGLSSMDMSRMTLFVSK
jgi:hypothetical protein